MLLVNIEALDFIPEGVSVYGIVVFSGAVGPYGW